MRSVVIQVLVVVVIGAAGYGLWSHRDKLPFFGGGDAPAAQSASRPPIPVDAVPARADSVVVTIEALGTARANEAVTVTSEVTGVISRIRFEEGQQVGRGDVLVDFDSRVEAAEVELRQADIQVRQAELENAQQLYDRAVKLVETQNIPMARLDELAAQLKAARAAVKSAEAAVKAAQARLVKQRVLSPFPGRLGMRHVSLGTLIEPGDPIVTLDDTSVIKLDFQIPERNLSHVGVDQEIAAITDAYPGEVFFGTVTAIDTRIDPVTRAVTVRAVMPNQNNRLKPGMFMLVELGISARQNAIIIPEQAVIADGTIRFVYVIADGAAERRDVDLGQRMRGEVEVLDGVEAGELVIVGGVQKVRDGAPVAPRDAGPPTS